MLQALQQQQTQTLNRLRSQPAAGRLVITISSNISEWENTPADIFLRAGDVITIPRKPNFVLAYGQVYNPTAVTYEPGKPAEWYLAQAGGPTELALKKAIYVIRANGSVVSSQGSGWFKGNVLSTKLRPGDILVVPEKALGGSSAWKTALETAQLVASLSRCRWRCCSLLDGIPIPMRVEPGEHSAVLQPVHRARGRSIPGAATSGNAASRLRQARMTTMQPVIQSQRSAEELAGGSASIPHHSVSHAVGQPVFHRPRDLRQLYPGRQRHRNRSSSAQGLQHHQPGG